jgi:hypothetical protein
VQARQGKGEGGLARACLQMSGEVGEGENGEQRGEARGAGVLSAAVVSACRGRDHHGLGNGAVRSGRRSELSAVMYLVWSGARRWARKRAVFSLPARLDELVRDALVGFGLDGGV